MFILQPSNNFFTRNFTYDLSLIEKPVLSIRGKIFDFYHEYRTEISGYLFQASMIDQEIIEFIKQKKQNTRIYLYFDQFNTQLYKDASSMVKCILKETKLDSRISATQQKNTIKIGPMFSSKILNNFQRVETTDLKDAEDIICDISELVSLPEALENVLYPKTKLKIKMFNNENIKNIQNLGYVDDLEFVSMIDRCKAYIDTNNNFLLYSLLLNKPTISLEANNIIKKTKDIDEKAIDETQESSIKQIDILKNSYQNFIQKYII